MGALRFRLWAQLRALLRRMLLSLIRVNEPWTAGEVIDVTRPAVRRMIARARLERRREAGALVCWSYSRDRQQEQFWLWQARVQRARMEKKARREALRLVV